MKSYKLRTLKDISAIVTEENVDGFLKDFEAWLRMNIKVRKMPFVGDMFESPGFEWRDDGDYGKCTEIKIVDD